MKSETMSKLNSTENIIKTCRIIFIILFLVYTIKANKLPLIGNDISKSQDSPVSFGIKSFAATTHQDMPHLQSIPTIYFWTTSPYIKLATLRSLSATFDLLTWLKGYNHMECWLSKYLLSRIQNYRPKPAVNYSVQYFNISGLSRNSVLLPSFILSQSPGSRPWRGNIDGGADTNALGLWFSFRNSSSGLHDNAAGVNTFNRRVMSFLNIYSPGSIVNVKPYHRYGQLVPPFCKNIKTTSNSLSSKGNNDSPMKSNSTTTRDIININRRTNSTTRITNINNHFSDDGTTVNENIPHKTSYGIQHKCSSHHRITTKVKMIKEHFTPIKDRFIPNSKNVLSVSSSSEQLIETGYQFFRQFSLLRHRSLLVDNDFVTFNLHNLSTSNDNTTSDVDAIKQKSTPQQHLVHLFSTRLTGKSPKNYKRSAVKSPKNFKRSEVKSPKNFKRSEVKSPKNFKRSAVKSPKNFKRSEVKSPKNFKRSTVKSPKNFKRSEVKSPENFKRSEVKSPNNFKRSAVKSPKNFKRSEVKSPKNFKRSTLLNYLQSPSFDFLSKFNSSTLITSTPSTLNINHSNRTHNRLDLNALTTEPSDDMIKGKHRSKFKNSNIFTSDNIRELSSKNHIKFKDVESTLSVQKNSELVNDSQELNISTWFVNISSGFMKHPNISQSSSDFYFEPNKEQVPVQSFVKDLGPCTPECRKNHGICVMGNDFKPHCVIAPDVCQKLHCVNGKCVSRNNVYLCECHQGWVGTFCDKTCILDCGKNGMCGRIDENDTAICTCNWNYTGYRCEEKMKIKDIAVPWKELKPWEIAFASALSVGILAVVCILLPYILWKRQWIPIKKLVFYFQDYEDDDNKEYDAFISYKSTQSDETFILQHLYPKLEKELHFKLCLHFRDFQPGEPIANNIIRAIENSRRTILILSPSFISSEWCRMEYQKAQYEMIKLKHKIIPIILEDISNVPEIDKNLKSILDTVTYIKWPGDDVPKSSKRFTKFWKLLELSMPKWRSEYTRDIRYVSEYLNETSLTTFSNCSSGNSVSSLTEHHFPPRFTSLNVNSTSESENVETNIYKPAKTELFIESTCLPEDPHQRSFEMQHQIKNSDGWSCKQATTDSAV